MGVVFAGQNVASSCDHSLSFCEAVQTEAQTFSQDAHLKVLSHYKAPQVKVLLLCEAVQAPVESCA